MKSYEYGVGYKNKKSKDGQFESIHRSQMTKEEAELFVSETNKEMKDKDFFVVVKREISPWVEE